MFITFYILYIYLRKNKKVLYINGNLKFNVIEIICIVYFNILILIIIINILK